MNKNLEKILLEMFGDPIDSKFGMKIGQLPGIKTLGSAGVRNKETNDALDLVCKSCGSHTKDAWIHSTKSIIDSTLNR